MNNFLSVKNYIKENWIKTVKPREVEEGFIMPYEYIAPCMDGSLVNLYYWDTYFTNKGLYIDGLQDYAYQNIEDLKYCLRLFKCVPNMCRANGATYASQPPLLFAMVKDYYNFSKDLHFLADSYDALKIEYDFWMTKRITKTGLNQYGTNLTKPSQTELDSLSSYLAERTKIDVSSLSFEQKYELFFNRIGEGESGEDHTPRFLSRAGKINAVDLNSHLFGFENTMAEFSVILNCGEESIWLSRAEKRKQLMIELCMDKTSGVFFDYDYENQKQTGIYCAANYLPFLYGITASDKALDAINKKLIMQFGVLSCEFIQAEGVFQWGFPNMWAPHNYFAYIANKVCKNTSAAQTIAEKYVYTVADEFVTSGRLWEKYDAVKGGKATIDEYGTPEMLGWTAGVFNFFYEELNKQ